MSLLSRIGVAVLAVVCAGSVQAADVGILVPAYFYPTNNSVHWAGLNAAAADVPLTAIMNPGSGPGTGIDTNYVSAVDSLRAAGGTVIGYVATTYGAKSVAAVQSEIDQYASWYNIDGIFFDEMTNTNNASDLNYYESIYNYVKGINANWQVIGNPGINTVEAYASRPTADVLVVTEQTAASHSGYSPSAWNANYPRDRFAHLVHTQPTEAGMLANIDQSVSQNAGLVYVTDDVLGNPWDRLPTYWDAEVARVKAINASGTVDPPVKPGAIETHFNPVASGAIVVASGNHDRSDWAGVPGYQSDPAGDAGPEVDYTELQVAHDDTNFFLRVQRDPATSQPLNSIQNIFIDADQNRSTGFIGGGGFLPIGVDYLLQGGTLYSFSSGNAEVWGWTSIGNAAFDDVPNTDIELAFARSLIGDPTAFDFVLNAANNFATGTEDYYPNGGNTGASGDYFTYATVAVGIAGDYNGNGQVEQGDLDLVLLNWGSDTAVAGVPAGWTNDAPTGLIDQAELDGVLLNWGATSEPNLGGSSVPEPASLGALVVLGVLGLRRREK